MTRQVAETTEMPGTMGDVFGAEVSRDDLDFGVRKEHIFIKRGKSFEDLSKPPVKGEKSSVYADRYALWNQKDDMLLSVVSSRYHAVEHTSILNALDAALKNLRLKPSRVKYYSTDNRNLAWIDMNLRPKEVAIGDEKDKWQVGVGILHGLDGIRGLHVSSFVFREICSNGLRSTKLLGKERKTHRNPDLVPWFENTVRNTLEELDKRFSLIPKLVSTPIKIETFEEKVEKLLGKEFLEQVQEQIKTPSNINPLYNVKEKQISLYDALNVLTFVNTIRSDIGARVLATRHTRIENVINSFIPG